MSAPFNPLMNPLMNPLRNPLKTALTSPSISSTASAFARANLIGEHTDYNGGFVLPTLLPFQTTVMLEESRGSALGVLIHSEALGLTTERAIDAVPANDWTDYVMACFFVLKKRGIAAPPARVNIRSNIPMGAGISSSAALLVAVLRGLRSLIGFTADEREIALMANEAERDYVGVPCGIIDQFACALGAPGFALMLDTKHQTYSQVELPPDHEVILVNSGKKHELTAALGYRQRVAECQQACQELQITSLRDLGTGDLDRISRLSSPLLVRRVRHVVTENQRVLDAAAALK
nr:hypothetical protein [Pseudomonadota bacterium]